MVDLAFARGREGLDQQIWHQIEIDVPRTRPGVRLWMHAGTQRVRAMSLNSVTHHIKNMLCRAWNVFSTYGLYGIQRVDMCKESMILLPRSFKFSFPLTLVIKFSVYVHFPILTSLLDTDPENFDPSLLPLHALSAIEADSFWCLSRLLDGIQDNYIFAQPGIQRSVKRMAELIARIDGRWNFLLILFLRFIIFSLSQLLYRLTSNHKTSNSCSSPSVG
jgi:TBC1 domain family member 2